LKEFAEKKASEIG